MNQEIHITQLKIKKNTVSLGFTLKEPVSDISVNLVCRNPAYSLSYPFQCTVTSGQVTASLDVSSLTLAEGDWDVVVSIPGKAPLSTILGGRLRARLLLGNYRIIKDQKIVEKKALHLPKQICNVIRCKNPRCITSIEHGLSHIFVLTDPETETYRCKYCEEKYDGRLRSKKIKAK